MFNSQEWAIMSVALGAWIEKREKIIALHGGKDDEGLLMQAYALKYKLRDNWSDATSKRNKKSHKEPDSSPPWPRTTDVPIGMVAST